MMTTGADGKGKSRAKLGRGPNPGAVSGGRSSGAVNKTAVNASGEGEASAEQEPRPTLAPLRSSPPRLDPKQSPTEALSEICRVVVQQILHNWGVVLESDEPEGPHQMRIGLRRLRSALKAFRPFLDNDESLRQIDDGARDLGRVLSELRDADVLATDILDAVLASHEDDADLLSLKAALSESRKSHRQRVREILDGEEWDAFRIRLAALPEFAKGVGGDTSAKGRKKRIEKLAPKILEKRWRSVSKAGRRLDKLTIEERHELRKDLKTLRYTIELVAPLYPAKDVRRFTDKLRRLQDRFGYLNDLVVAKKLKSLDADAYAAAGIQRAVGYVLGWHTGHADDAWNRTKRDWRRLERAQKFWSQ